MVLRKRFRTMEELNEFLNNHHYLKRSQIMILSLCEGRDTIVLFYDILGEIPTTQSNKISEVKRWKI